MSEPATTATTIDAIEAALKAAIASTTHYTGIAIVNERVPGAKITGDYIGFVLALQEGTQRPVVTHASTDSGLSETIEDLVYMTAQITAHGVRAIAALNKFRLLLQSSARNFDLFALVGMGECSQIQNTSTEFQGVMIPSASMQLSLNAVLSETLSVDYFNRAAFDIQTDEPDSHQLVTIPPEEQP
jgi:hypothetical protein